LINRSFYNAIEQIISVHIIKSYRSIFERDEIKLITGLSVIVVIEKKNNKEITNKMLLLFLTE